MTKIEKRMREIAQIERNIERLRIAKKGDVWVDMFPIPAATIAIWSEHIKAKRWLLSLDGN